MNFPQQPNRALELLADMVPSEVLKRARALALEIERDEYLRKYIEARSFLVALAGTGVAIALLVLLGMLWWKIGILFGPLGTWQKLSLVAFFLALWIGLLLLFMYFLLSALQRAALAQLAGERKPPL